MGKVVEFVSFVNWQARYLEDDTPWDKGCAAPSLIGLVNDYPHWFSGQQSFLVPGGGLGHDAAALAHKVGSVLALDIAPAALTQAEEIYGALENLKFEQADLFQLSAEFSESFDVVWEHTCFCAIETQLRRDYVRSMWNALKAGGRLIGIFFINPDVEAGEGPPFGASVDEICATFGGYFELEQEIEPRSYYEGREGREKLLVFKRLGY